MYLFFLRKYLYFYLSAECEYFCHLDLAIVLFFLLFFTIPPKKPPPQNPLVCFTSRIGELLPFHGLSSAAVFHQPFVPRSSLPVSARAHEVTAASRAVTQRDSKGLRETKAQLQLHSRTSDRRVGLGGEKRP